jgi:hypothetical protein
MSKRLCSVVLLAAATIGCATADGYERVVSGYIGSSEEALLAQWGPPDRVYTADGGAKYLTYLSSRSGSSPGIPPIYQTSCSFGQCTTIPVGGSPGYTFTKSCKTSFKIESGIVAS